MLLDWKQVGSGLENQEGYMFTTRIFLSVLFFIGCLAHPPLIGAMEGQFGLEFSIDAPWRLEPVPVKGGGNFYGPIPISITFHDAIFDHHRDSLTQAAVNTLGPLVGVNLNLEKRHVGLLQHVVIEEGGSNGQKKSLQILAKNMREIERKRWISTKKEEPEHELCRPGTEITVPIIGKKIKTNCENLLDITDSHEWHAMFWYTPQLLVTPGRNIQLKVTVVTKYQGKERHWTNALVVHVGEEPLPRFGKDWMYGDFHYHSQMTDNEGESGYSYRNVIRSMGAMGMDFLFTTDHASDSEQVDGAIGVARCGSIMGQQCIFDTGGGNNSCTENGQTRQCLFFKGTEARDLNQPRFTAAKQIIYGPDGANEAIGRDLETGGFARYRSEGVVPQLFMGEEVDAMPEMSLEEFKAGKISYGDWRRYPWSDVNKCTKLPNSYTACQIFYGDSLACDVRKSVQQICSERFSKVEGNRYFTRDNQGIPHWSIAPEPSRQHLVYFPLSGVSDGNGFVPSRTGDFGGASRPLDDVLREMESKGVTFLAHPLIGDKPGSQEGPDMIPYSDLSLHMAWSSRAVLGLQLWNENARLKSTVDINIPPPSSLFAASEGLGEIIRDHARLWEAKLPDGGKSYTSVMPFLGKWSSEDPAKPWHWQTATDNNFPRYPGEEQYGRLYHGAFTWDRYLRKGLMPSETARLSWLPPGEPRKWFMAGGSDAHGDLNYLRSGYLCAQEWCLEKVDDTAIGNPRNLVLLGAPNGPPLPGTPTVRRQTNEQVINALKEGRFSVTDGPALRMAIDRNRNGQLDDADYPMGFTFNLFPNEEIPVLIEWKSTPEFGRVKKIDLYVGNKERTFASYDHGPLHTVCTKERPTKSPNPLDLQVVKDYAERMKCDESVDAYLKKMGVLQIDLAGVDPKLGYQGIAKVFLNPREFGISQHDETSPLFYVRAYAQTYGRTDPKSGCTPDPLAPGKCGDRHAYTNPVWGRYTANCLPNLIARHGRGSLDGKIPNFPDACTAAPPPDPCPSVPSAATVGAGSKFSSVSGMVAPRPGNVSVDPAAPATGQPAGRPLRSCKIVTSIKPGPPPGIVAPPSPNIGEPTSPQGQKPPTMTVNVKTVTGQYVVAEGTGAVHAKPSAVGGATIFTLIDLNGGFLTSGDKVHLRTPGGTYLVAEGGGGREVKADRRAASEWETFIIRKKSVGTGNLIGFNEPITLQAHNGQYVAAEGGGGGAVNANRPKADLWETFQLMSGPKPPATVFKPVFKSPIMKRGLEETGMSAEPTEPTEGQEEDVLYLEILEGLNEREEGQMSEQPPGQPIEK